MVLKSAKLMERISLSSNVSFAAELPSGSAGDQPIFVKSAIHDKTKAITSPKRS